MRRFLDWFLTDRASGKIVLAQWPNLPLWLFALSAGLAAALEAGLPAPSAIGLPGWSAAALAIAAMLALAWWALDEMLRGVNPWRRCLGAIALLALFWRVASRL